MLLLSITLMACGQADEGEDKAASETQDVSLSPRDDNATYPQDLNPEQYEKHLNEAFDRYIDMANENPDMTHDERLAELYTENPDLEERSSADILQVYQAMRLRENGYTMKDFSALSDEEKEKINGQLQEEAEEFYPNAVADQEKLKALTEKIKDDPDNEEDKYFKIATLDDGSHYAMTYWGEIVSK